MIVRTSSAADLRFAAVILLVALLTVPALCQEEDLNVRYAFPLSLGAEYQMLTPFGSYAGGSFVSPFS